MTQNRTHCLAPFDKAEAPPEAPTERADAPASRPLNKAEAAGKAAAVTWEAPVWAWLDALASMEEAAELKAETPCAKLVEATEAADLAAADSSLAKELAAEAGTLVGRVKGTGATVGLGPV